MEVLYDNVSIPLCALKHIDEDMFQQGVQSLMQSIISSTSLVTDESFSTVIINGDEIESGEHITRLMAMLIVLKKYPEQEVLDLVTKFISDNSDEVHLLSLESNISVLMVAVGVGIGDVSWNLFCSLVNNTVKVNHQNIKGNTAVHYAVKFKRQDELDYLVTGIGTDVNVENKAGDTPLHLAVSIIEDDTRQLETLVNVGDIDLEALDDEGLTPLAKLVSGKITSTTVKATGLLLDAGAKASTASNGDTLLHLLCNGRVKNGRLSYLIFRLESVTDINAQNSEGYTPLHYTVMYNPYGIDTLLSYDADVNIVNNKGESPLHLAMMHNLPIESVESLLDAGAKVNTRDKNGLTPIYYAANHREFNSELIELLLKRGATFQTMFRRVKHS